MMSSTLFTTLLVGESGREQRTQRSNGYSQRWITETSYLTTKRALGDAVRALGWYQQFREIVLMFAAINIESLCELL
jgi:IS5 family transposase